MYYSLHTWILACLTLSFSLGEAQGKMFSPPFSTERACPVLNRIIANSLKLDGTAWWDDGIHPA